MSLRSGGLLARLVCYTLFPTSQTTQWPEIASGYIFAPLFLFFIAGKIFICHGWPTKCYGKRKEKNSPGPKISPLVSPVLITMYPSEERETKMIFVRLRLLHHMIERGFSSSTHKIEKTEWQRQTSAAKPKTRSKTLRGKKVEGKKNWVWKKKEKRQDKGCGVCVRACNRERERERQQCH